MPLAEQRRRLADPVKRRQLVAEEERMKPRDNVLQGGGAATTDPRKPDYANLYAMKGVDWDDPTVAQLSAQRGQHPVEVMIDLALQNDDLVRTGFKADLVLFDAERVKPAMPTVETDLPGGARRLVQKAEGIAAT
ncbi:MAG: hypothetical protein ACRD88_03840, partial [Terriglobia bacterium]